MGKKLDALLHRRSKLKTAINHAISRLTILKNNRHARFTIARSDLVQLLRLNHHQQALLRVEQVIKDQNMLVVYDMIHDYCHVLKQRVNSIEQAIDCPEELKQAVSSLLYAAPRCGEFPELQEIREILTARFGKDHVGSASELRSNSGVSIKMIQKLSSKEWSLESRTIMLTGIAKEYGIILQLDATVLPEKNEKVLETAAYAAAATKVAVELTHSESYSSDGPESPDSLLKNKLNAEPVNSKLHMSDSSSRYDSESDYEEIIEEDEGERTKYMEVEEYDDLYPNDYSDEDNIKSFEKMDFDESKYKIDTETTGFPSRTVYFSSYKQFPIKHQAIPKTGLGR